VYEEEVEVSKLKMADAEAKMADAER